MLKNKPIVVRLKGLSAESANKTLEEFIISSDFKYNIHVCTDFDEACEKAALLAS